MTTRAASKRKDPKAKERKALSMQRAFWVAMDTSERKTAEKSWRGKWGANWANERDTEGKTMLHWALLAINAGEIVRLAEKEGMDVLAQDKRAPQGALHSLASSVTLYGILANIPESGFEAQVTELMLAKGADPNELDAKGSIPLHWAGMMGNIACAKALLAAGANPIARDKSGKTPLACAKEAPPTGMGLAGDALTRNKKELAKIIAAAAEAWRLNKTLSARKKKENAPKSKKLRV